MIETLPPSVRDYALRILLDARRLAYLEVDAQGVLHGSGGDLSAYGIDALQNGRAADEQVSFLVGLLPLDGPQLTLAAMRIDSGACIDLHMWAENNRVYILFVDGTVEHDRQQAMQQKGNELSLHNERQSRVLDAHLGKSIAGEILEGRWQARGGGERRRLTILFADIREFTPFCEQSPPEQVFGTLNQYMPAMLDPIAELGGVVDKIIGDAVMGVFGLRDLEQDAARQAVLAALRISDRVAAVNSERAKNGEPTLGIGIGLATGEVAVGVIGTVERRGFTAIGHHVNFAARLQNYARAGEIIIDEDTCRAIDAAALGFFEQLISLKGFREKVRAFSRQQ